MFLLRLPGLERFNLEKAEPPRKDSQHEPLPRDACRRASPTVKRASQALNASIKTEPRRYLILPLFVFCLFLAACKVEVYSGLNEEQTNLMLGVLLKRGVDVSKENKGKNGFSLLVEEGQMVQALDVLRENGLPHDRYQSLGDVFKGQGMISSPSEEDARLAFAISQELSDTFSRMDGVLSARVHVVLGKVDEAVNLRILPSVGVFIRHNPDSTVVNMVAKIRELAAHSVPGLSEENVSVMLSPVRETVTVPPPVTADLWEKYMIPALLAALFLGVGMGMVISRMTRDKRNDKGAPEA
ncbi:MAG: type III secretion inner membrane ring lipoprotein SctJ [Desulfovibrio sp.]|jgi:type III secretion protein J|nr:type III secretion inner membrane ring lipoprotein SctJ [Desulfovibrio sp.]